MMRSAPPGTMREPGAAAALGAGLGFVFTGLLLPRAPIPASLIVACLVLLSGAGLVYGTVLGAQAFEVTGAVADAHEDQGERSASDRVLPADGLTKFSEETGTT